MEKETVTTIFIIFCANRKQHSHLNFREYSSLALHTDGIQPANALGFKMCNSVSLAMLLGVFKNHLINREKFHRITQHVNEAKL